MTMFEKAVARLFRGALLITDFLRGEGTQL